MEGPFTNRLVLQILEKYRIIWSLNHSLALMSWDGETYMPEAGVEERSIAVSQLNVLIQKLVTDQSFVSLVDNTARETSLNEYEKGLVRVLERTIKINKKLPPSLVEEIAMVSEEAKVVWRNARLENDFNAFQPYLERIVDLSRKKAEYLGYEEHPYDALLDLYEEGLTCRDVDKVFEVVTPAMEKVLKRVEENRLFPQRHSLENVRYDLESMERVNLTVAKQLGYDQKRFRMDVSAHPFTQEMGIRDVRITTRYEMVDFKSTLYSVIHEYGHALYALQVDESLLGSPIFEGVSLGIHESQSRFWENIIGRSRQFSEAIFPILKDNLGFLSGYTHQDVYYYFNTVRPSLIRVEADEVTYNFHVLLRYELEKELIAGNVKVSELPELWNSTMEKYFGIAPKNYSEGVLQDIHWSQGSIGYFPTYTLGTVISAQLLYHIIRDIPDFNDLVYSMNFAPIKEWLKNKIHKWGSTYQPQELLRKNIGEEMNPQYFTRYLEEKYLKSN